MLRHATNVTPQLIFSRIIDQPSTQSVTETTHVVRITVTSKIRNANRRKTAEVIAAEGKLTGLQLHRQIIHTSRRRHPSSSL
jgi:hypothetical protein